MRRSQRGFTLLETLVALGATTTLGFFLLSAVGGVLHWNAMLAERERGQAAVSALADRLEAEEDSAWAIFTPPADVLGQNNGDGHELDFFTRDGQSRPYFWAYRFDRSAQKLQRYLYAMPGGNPIADGPSIAGITSFGAQTFPITALQDASTPLFSALYQNATLQPAIVHFGYGSQPWIAGGNQVTHVRLESLQSVRVLELTTQTAPSGFTVVLRYTPSPGPTQPASPALTAMIETWKISGVWRDCPDRTAGCSNADWPAFFWKLSTIYRSYQSLDGGYSWTLTGSTQENDSGVSTPTGGDTPYADCSQGEGFDFVYACSTSWSPSAPPGTAGMDFSQPR